MYRKTLFIIALSIFIATFYLVFSGAEILNKPFINAINFPFGTIISWLGIVAFPFTLYVGLSAIYYAETQFSKNYQIILKIIILMAIFWGLIGYYLADNWAYNFSTKKVFRGSENAADFFWLYTFIVLVLPIVFLVVYGLHLVINRFKAT